MCAIPQKEKSFKNSATFGNREEVEGRGRYSLGEGAARNRKEIIVLVKTEGQD